MKFCINHKNRKVFAKGLCGQCYKIKYSKPLKRTPLKRVPFFIKPIADKRKKQLEALKTRRKAFLALHSLCQIKGLHCQIIASEIHEMAGREGNRIEDESLWKATCRSCHTEITKNSAKAIAEGNSISRIKK